MANIVVHKIVSNVDTIVVLKTPSIYFAPWENPEIVAAKEKEVAECAARLWGTTGKKQMKKSKKKITESKKPNSIQQSIFGGGSPYIIPKVVTTNELKLEENGDTEARSKVQIDTQIKADVEPLAEVQCIKDRAIEEDGIHFHVCSGNLMSASPWFNRVLKRDGWIESIRNGEDKRFHIFAKYWDENAFLILMNMFHLRTREVPRTISLDMLGKIALLVDYYECGEAIKMFSDIWIADLRKTVPIPTTYCRDLVLWIWVSWVFRLPDRYQESTEVAIKKCTESIRNLGLPIPSLITGVQIFFQFHVRVANLK
jgi:hypothetical protein